MTFAHSERLWLLLFVPFLAALVWRGRRQRFRDWQALKGRGNRPGDPAWGWTLAIIGLIFAIAQPRWGRLGGERPPGEDVVLQVDTSRSMAVEDAVPNRLGSAIETAEAVIQALGRDAGNRVAVVAFAGRGVVRCPLTENLGAAIEALRTLKPGDVAPAGTDLGAGLDASLDAFDPDEPSDGRVILVFSDGEDHEGAWRDRIPRLQEAKVTVHAVVVGDPAKGRAVPSGKGSPLIYQGKPAVSNRSDAALTELTRRLGGVLVPLGLAKGDALGAMFRDRIGPAVRRQRQIRDPRDPVERFPIFVASAIVCGVLGSWRPGRSRAILMLMAIMVVGAAPPGNSARQAVAAGNAAYRKGDYAAALTAFQSAAKLDPQSVVPLYNQAAALLKLGRAGEAIARYRHARERADASLRMKIDYALGNAELALGDVEAAIRHYDDCLASQVAGPAADAVRNDAAENRRFALLHRPRRSADPQGNSGPNPAPAGSKDNAKKTPEPGKPQEKQDPGKSPDVAGEPPPVGNSKAQTEQPDGIESPRKQLENALKNVRDARNRRIPDSPPPTAAGGDRKDW